MTLPLSDLKVVEYGEYISAPYCAKLLADLGAEVLKVEPPEGETARRNGPFPGDVPHPEASGLFLWLNTSKLGVTLNGDAPTGRRILLDLLRQADVFIENRTPKEMEAKGLDYATLKGINPRLIVTSITPYGWTGPYRDKKGYDINACALGGVTFSIGEERREPLTLPLSLGDCEAGLAAAAATLVATTARRRTGQGQHVDVASYELWATLHQADRVITFTFLGGIGGQRFGRRRAWLYPNAVLPCKDGYICTAALEGHQWRAFLELMGNPPWTQDPKYRDRRAITEKYSAEVDELVLPWFKERTKAEIFARCQERKVPFTPVRTIDEVVDDPHLRERGFFRAVDRPCVGRLTYPGAPYTFSRSEWRLRPAPLLGEHNEQVYCGRLGFSHQDLAELRRTGIV